MCGLQRAPLPEAKAGHRQTINGRSTAMTFNLTLTIALVIFAIGLVHRIDRWFMLDAGTGERGIPVSRRLTVGLKAILAVLFSARIFALLKVLVVDVLFQVRILRDRQDPLAWVMHLGIFWGFVLLLLFHALGGTLGRAVDPDYQSTLNPYLWLRNLCGLLVLAGLTLAVIRRVVRRGEIRTTGGDVFAIAILAVIILSGFLLEGVKITSRTDFQRMVDDYGRNITAEETQALEAYWAAHYGLAAGAAKVPPAADLLALGEEVNAASCISCHSRPQSAFVSYPISRLILPVAAGLDRSGFGTMLYYLHFLACFAGLAWLAFGKMSHIFSTPVSLIVAEAARRDPEPAAAAMRQMIELDGCSHGGACHAECPVRVRRIARIEQAGLYDPMLAYLGAKSPQELGSRKTGGR
jgi:nitrate reductase gamma subunit